MTCRSDFTSTDRGPCTPGAFLRLVNQLRLIDGFDSTPPPNSPTKDDAILTHEKPTPPRPANNVYPVARWLRQEAALAAQGPPARGQLVRKCRRLPPDRPEVCHHVSTNPFFAPNCSGRKGKERGGLHTHRSDDLIPEESEVVQTALGRLNEKERYDRIFRIRRAIQCSIQHQLLPKNEWTKPDQDTLYLSPIIKAVEAENKERENLDNLTVYKKH